MKKNKFIFTTILLLGLCLQPFAQNDNRIYYMDSLHVINNALAKRIFNGHTQYIMMPTQYNTNIANGTLHLLILDANTLNVTSKQFFTSAMKGAIINDLRVDANNNIFFAGTLGGVGIYGELDNIGNIQWLRKDSSFKEIFAMDYCSLTNNERLLFCGCNNANKNVHGLHTVSGTTRNVRTSDTIYTHKSYKDIVYYNGGTQLLLNGGIMLRYNSSNQADIISFNAQAAGINSQSKTVTIPTGWHWHEGGGAITHVEDNKYIAAIDVRNSTMEVDGVFFIKFNITNTGKISVYDTKIISFPEPKVVVKDILFIDDPIYDDVSYNVIGQYITNDLGLPFILKTDTSFTNYSALEYMTFQSGAEECNFRLNKTVYDGNAELMVASGAFDAHPGTFNTGGIYITLNLPGDFWTLFSNCETDIPLTTPTTSASSTSLYLQSVNSTVSLPYISINVVSQITLPQDIILCNKGNVSEKRSINRNISNELGFSVQDNRIIYENSVEGTTFEIFNAIGKRVMTGHTTNEIDITPLRKGLYVIRVMSNGETISIDKFVK